MAGTHRESTRPSPKAELAELDEANAGTVRRRSEARRQQAFKLLIGRDERTADDFVFGHELCVLPDLELWSFLYLRQVQPSSSMVESAWLAALPPLGAAALGAGLGGGVTDSLCARFGLRFGATDSSPSCRFRWSPPYWSSPYSRTAPPARDRCLDVGLLPATVELNEGPFWAAAMRVSGSHTMTATGLLNTGGAAGGLIGIPIVAYTFPVTTRGTPHFCSEAAVRQLAQRRGLGVDAKRRAKRSSQGWNSRQAASNSSPQKSSILDQWLRVCSSSSVCFSLSNFSPASASFPAAVSR